jgi:carbon-monoxide dehydrogenase large subunit
LLTEIQSTDLKAEVTTSGGLSKFMASIPRQSNAFIGSPVERREDLRFLRGRGEYVDDVSRPNLLHAAILRSPVAHGCIVSIDGAAARARPGVHAVITAADLGGAVPKIPLRMEALPAFTRFEQPVIADRKVRYVGEPLVVVVADTQAIAEDTLEVIAVDIDPLPAVADRDMARKGEVLAFEENGTNLTSTLIAAKGDAQAAFRNAHYTRKEHFKVQRFTAVPMESRGFLAEWNDGRLTVYGTAKVAFPNRRILSKQFGIPESAIRMVENDVGGGFGVRGEFYPEDFLIPFAAKVVGRPVKWVEDRREHLIASNHARDIECELEIACDRDGTILALRGHAYSDIGAYIRTNGAAGSRNVIQVLSGPYNVPNIHIDVSLLVTNKTPAGTYRGPGRFEADFFRERMLDLAAKDLGIDRVAFRRRNLIAEEQMPYALATVEPLGIGTETDSGDYRMTFDRCLKEIGWADKIAMQGKLIGGKYHGFAVGAYLEGGASGPREHARLQLEKDGTVSVFVGSSAVGQGVETVFAQIAADAMEVPMARINTVRHGSTDIVSEGFGSYSSRSVVMCGNAIFNAAAKLHDAIRAAAAKRLDCTPQEIEIREDKVSGPKGASVALGEFGGLTEEATFSSNKRTYSYGTHAAHVTVDPNTGDVKVLDYVAVEDVGRIINPETLHGQTVGAIVQGLGGALLEHLVYDENGQLLTGSLADYLMPTASDFSRIHVIALEDKPSPHNPLGAKGAGEGGIIPVGGVIANAVANALSSLGVEPRELPLSPPRVWQLIAQAKRPQR